MNLLGKRFDMVFWGVCGNMGLRERGFNMTLWGRSNDLAQL